MKNWKKNYLKFSIVLPLVAWSPTIVNSQNIWVELQSEYQYRKNDFYISDFENYHLVLAESRFGVNFCLKKPILSFQPYLAISAILDAGKKSWNDVDWHNNSVYGMGARLRLNPGKLLFLQPKELNIDVFVEVMKVYFFPRDLFFTGHRPKDDVKAGIQYWLSLGKSEGQKKWTGYFWWDNSGSLYYAKSSFFVLSQTNYFLLNSHSRFGGGCQILNSLQAETYLTYELIHDFGSKGWNKLDWHNRFHYGFGGRLKFLYHLTNESRQLSIAVIPFIEYLQITYADKVPYIPSYRPKNDLQLGFNLWFSFN